MCITAIKTFTNNCLRKTIVNIREIIKTANYMRSYIEFMNYEDVINERNIVPEKMDYKIELESVSFKYPNRYEYVLININITINSEEHLSIVGQNGDGKTTFI